MVRKDGPITEYVLKIGDVSWINHDHEVNGAVFLVVVGEFS